MTFVVEHEVPVVTPRCEQALLEPGALDALQPLGRDDLVGVDVAAPQRHRIAAEHPHHLHARSSGAARRPATAVAAANAGDTRWVRPPRPWRPSKFRFDVEAHRSPGDSLSGFMARHIEQPGSRQSNPASRSTTSSPSASAWAFTAHDPGTTRVRTPEATCRPLATEAASRRS